MFFAKLQAMLFVIIAGLFCASALIVGILIYLFKIKKISAKDEKIDYSHFDKLDILDYLRFDDVIECGTKEHGFGIVKHGQVYTAAMDITGYNFAEATPEEQQSTMIKAISFVGLIKEDVQLRQAVSAIQLQENIDEHTLILKKLEEELAELNEEFDITLRQAEDLEGDPDNEDTYYQYVEKATELKNKIESTKWLCDECEVLIMHMDATQGKGGEVQKTHQIIFSYVFNPNDFTEEPTEDEIWLRAQQELRTKATNYARGLERCGCKCRPLSAVEYIEVMFNHFHPLNTNIERFDEITENAITHLVTKSKSLEDIKEDVKFQKYYEQYLRETEGFEMDLNRETRIVARNNGVEQVI